MTSAGEGAFVMKGRSGPRSFTIFILRKKWSASSLLLPSSNNLLMLLLICAFVYVISSIFLFKFLGYRFEAFFIKDEGGTTVETSIVGRDDGLPVILPGVAYDLIDIR